MNDNDEGGNYELKQNHLTIRVIKKFEPVAREVYSNNINAIKKTLSLNSHNKK